MQSHGHKPVTRRCVYCRPRWTWGVRRWSLLGRIYAFLWPHHVIGIDYGPPYTDGMCDEAVRRMEDHDQGRAPREIEPVDILIAIFVAAVLAQYAYICRQEERLQHLRQIAVSIPLDARAQNGRKPCVDCEVCFRKNDTENPDCAHCLGCWMWGVNP